MNSESIYIETSIISYLTARPSNNLISAARQKITHDWWHAKRKSYRCFASELVVAEAAKGDHHAVQSRLEILQELPVLEIEKESVEIADIFFSRASLPEKARDDALHVAIATYYKIDFLLTWNCRHLANAHFIRRLQSIAYDEGLILPTICTPDEVGYE
jgi:predicted nucleic acid-binding protein